MLLPFLGFLYHLTGMALLVDLHVAADFHHVLHGDMLSDADHQFQACIHPLHDGVGSEAGRHIDDRGSCPCSFHGLLHRIEDRHALYFSWAYY